MNIKIIDKNGVTLKTKGKYCKEDISVSVDESILGITPTGTYQVTNNGEYDITEYAKVNVNVAGSGTTITGFADGTITEYSGQDTRVRGSVFYYCTSLIRVNLPNATSIEANAFEYCFKLENVNIPNATRIYKSAFSQCVALTSISFPNVTEIINGAFSLCKALTSIYIPKVTKISNEVFARNYSLKAVIICQETSVCTLSNTNAFNSCYHILGTVDSTYNPNGDKDGYIYVPSAMVDSYKSATNWSTYADQIKPLSELPQEYKDLYNIA